MRRKLQGFFSLIFVAIIIPLLFFLFSISLDINRYFFEQRKIQQQLDFAALSAAHELPDKAKTFNTFNSLFPSKDSRFINTNIQNSKAIFSYDGSLKLTFPQYFGVNLPLPLFVKTTAMTLPVDAFILIDTGSASAPQLGETWGDPFFWPAAEFFERGIFVNSEVSPSSLTQRCFNPALLPIKRAAIILFEHLAKIHTNKIGVGFYPALDTVTISRAVSSNDLSYHANFVDYSEAFARDSWCAAASEREVQTSAYKIPPSNLSDEPERTIPLTTQPDSVLNSDAISEIRVRDVIWTKAASTQSDSSLAPLIKALSLFSENSSNKKSVYILSNTLPTGSTFTVGDSSTQLIYILVPSPSSPSNLREIATNFEARIKSENPTLKFQLLFAPTTEALFISLIPSILKVERNVAISQ